MGRSSAWVFSPSSPCVVLVIALRAPALPVLGAGMVAAAWRLAHHQISIASLRQTLGLATLLGLLGLAVGFGSAARAWDGPAALLRHLDPCHCGCRRGVHRSHQQSARAALWAAHRPAHPLSLLIGLDVGPNIFLSGSLAWVLWVRSVRQAGAEPPVRTTVLLGALASLVAVPAAVGALYLVGSSR